jgi:hypothetical protein
MITPTIFFSLYITSVLISIAGCRVFYLVEKRKRTFKDKIEYGIFPMVAVFFCALPPIGVAGLLIYYIIKKSNKVLESIAKKL